MMMIIITIMIIIIQANITGFTFITRIVSGISTHCCCLSTTTPQVRLSSFTSPISIFSNITKYVGDFEKSAAKMVNFDALYLCLFAMLWPYIYKHCFHILLSSGSANTDEMWTTTSNKYQEMRPSLGLISSSLRLGLDRRRPIFQTVFPFTYTIICKSYYIHSGWCVLVNIQHHRMPGSWLSSGMFWHDVGR